MTDPEQKNEQDQIDEEFNDLMDAEFLEMLELIEKKNRGEISEAELKKLEYIRKSREFLYGGDA
ncbi:MAG TPA: hypothetical protein PLK90_00070 [Clostridiales bacterium]|nr:hypothetical protein [Clostridiales bacterium]HQP68779.1 hypothetical protein [Clostridiales bacterium]